MSFISTALNKISHWYFSKNALPYWCVLCFDCLVVLASGHFCYLLDYGPDVAYYNFWPLLGTLAFYLIFYIIGFRIFRTYSGVIRYTSFADINRIAMANLVGITGTAIASRFLNEGTCFVPIGLKALCHSFVLATAIMWSVRILVKFMFEHYRGVQNAKRVFIYGVKNGGLNIARALTSGESPRYSLKGFFSDAEDMPGKLLMGVRVYKFDKDIVQIMRENHANVLFVSPLKQADFIRNQEIVDSLIESGITIFTMNTNVQWDGKSQIQTSQLREVEIEDLLPRDEIEIDMKSIADQLTDSTIMVTGSAGSIGSEIVRQVAALKPRQLVLIDQAETPQHDIRLMMAQKFPDVKAETIVTSITNEKRMESIFRKYKPDFVFHAAAYKHVPMMEDNPGESIYNNVYGTKVIADMAVKYFTKKFVMISTDKAVNPTNVMGCSKRICEIYVQSLDKAIKDKQVLGITQFTTTRFGNVLGSNGSVIPLFREQIRQGGPVTVTDPAIIRYFMLISEACKLVLEAGAKGKGGQIFVFDMGKPVKIADLAKRMIKLSGATNVQIKYTGLRPGEKLYEEVLNEEETTSPSFHPKIRIATVREYDYHDVCVQIDSLISVSQLFDDMKTVGKMKEIVPEYKSNNSVYEALDNH